MAQRQHRGAALTARALLAMPMTLLLAALVAVTAGAPGLDQRSGRVDMVPAGVYTDGPCFGAKSLDRYCRNRYAKVSDAVAEFAATDKPIASREPYRCSDAGGSSTWTKVLCRYGDPTSPVRVLVWGNSHASAWSDAMKAAAQQLGWYVVVGSRSSCSATDPDAGSATSSAAMGCEARNRWILTSLVPRFDYVVMADLRAGFVRSDGTTGDLAPYTKAIDKVRAAGAKPIWLSDVPLTATLHTRRNGPDCLAYYGQCRNTLDRALGAYPVTTKIHQLRPSMPVIDVRSRFCTSNYCYAAIGGVSVYFDQVHLSGSYSRSIGPWMAIKLRDARRAA